MKIIFTFLLSFSISFFITPIIIRLANSWDCIDYPGKRSFHKDPIPRWGGLAFAVGVLPIFFMLELDKKFLAFGIAGLILLIIGSIDDCKNLGWRAKLLAVMLASTIFIFLGDIAIYDLGIYGLNKQIRLGWLAIPFTYLCIVGVTNSINLIDGLNGLAGGISFICFIFLGIGSMMSGVYSIGLICFSFAGALLAFLYFNFPQARIFMGDSGSLLLGFSMASLSILLTQGNNHIRTIEPILTEADLFAAALSEKMVLQPMFPVLVLILPIFDTLRVMSVRIFQRKNPFHADKTHLHHLFIRKGYSPVITVLILWSLTCLCGLFAIALIRRSATPYLVVVLIICLLMSLFAESMSRRKKVVRGNDAGGA